MTTEPIIGHRSAHARVAVRNGDAVRAGQLVADAAALAARMPPSHYVVNICRDRYAFAVGFCAALIAGRTCLLPPARASEALAQLAQRYPDAIIVGDDAADPWASSAAPAMPQLAALSGASANPVWPPPAIAREHVAAIAFTSGSTGKPQPQPKQWGRLVDGARAEVSALQLDEAPVEDVVLVGTVSAQHMYGLESTIMLALHGPCALAAEHPLHADEVSSVLSRISGRRVLVTTPVHLRALSESSQPLPALDRVISATAPLAPPLAARCESRWAARVFEIYGCTETGMVAARRTIEGPLWTTMRGVKVEQTGDGFEASGGHVQAGPLMDRLRLASATSFELDGRADDLVNIGGKRASLEGLNRLLLSIDGVEDGAIFLPDTEAMATREPRLIALIVAPECSAAKVLARLRTKVDAAFLPRPLLRVEALPRNAQGKLPRTELLALAARAQRAKSGAAAVRRMTHPRPRIWFASMGHAESSSERCAVAPDHPMLAGHFPGHPIVPGAWLLSWVMADATRRLRLAGDARPITGVKRVKFLRPLGPSESFECELSTGSDTVRFTLSSAAGVIATGILQLQPQAAT